MDKRILPKSKTSLLPGSGVDLEKFNVTEAVIKHRNASPDFNFVLSGRMLWSKGIGEYVLAAELIKSEFDHVNFWLVGFVNVDNKDAIILSDIMEWDSVGSITYKGSTDDIKSILNLPIASYCPRITLKERQKVF